MENESHEVSLVYIKTVLLHLIFMGFYVTKSVCFCICQNRPCLLTTQTQMANIFQKNGLNAELRFDVQISPDLFRKDKKKLYLKAKHIPHTT